MISPVLSNLFLHYVFDIWLQTHYPNTPWCRYADDGLVHCHSEEQAKHMLEVLKHRFEECGLELHPVKTKIVYCKDGSRRGDAAKFLEGIAKRCCHLFAHWRKGMLGAFV